MRRSTLLLALALLALGLAVAPRPGIASPRPAQTIAITIDAPAADATVADSLAIEVRVSSTFEISSVTASVGPLTTALTCCGGRFTNAYTNTLTLDGLARGPQTLTITVTDALGNSGQAQRLFFLDRLPTLSVGSPLDATVIYGNQLDVRFGCADDDPAGCQSVSVAPSCDWGEKLATGTASISQTLALGPADAAPLSAAELCLEGADSTGRRTYAARRVYFNAPRSLVRQRDVAGRIADADASRLLVSSSSPPALLLVDRASGAETLLDDNPRGGFTVGPDYAPRLTPDGAIYVVDRPELGPPDRVYHWRNGAARDIGPINVWTSLTVTGGYASWIEQLLVNGATATRLYRHDLRASTTISITAAGYIYDQLALLPGGDVIYATSGGQVRRFGDGVDSTLIEGGDFRRYYPVSDGVDLLYMRCDRDSRNCELIRLAGGVETVIAPTPDGASYQANNGWIAYTRPGSGGANQLWLRAPGGAEQRVSFLNQLHSIYALGPDGTLVWGGNSLGPGGQAAPNGSSFLSRPGQPAVPIGGSQAISRVFRRGDAWELAVGRTLFSVQSQRVSLPLLGR